MARAYWLANTILYVTMAAALIFFYVPIFTLIVFSFQKGRYLTLPFEGVSLRWYVQLFHNDIALNALWNSTLIAAIAMLIATVLGTMAAVVFIPGILLVVLGNRMRS